MSYSLFLLQTYEEYLEAHGRTSKQLCCPVSVLSINNSDWLFVYYICYLYLSMQCSTVSASWSINCVNNLIEVAYFYDMLPLANCICQDVRGPIWDSLADCIRVMKH